MVAAAAAAEEEEEVNARLNTVTGQRFKYVLTFFAFFSAQYSVVCQV